MGNFKSFNIKSLNLFGLAFFFFSTILFGQQPYSGTDDLGRVLPLNHNVGDPQTNKNVGIFYFLWHGHSGTPTSRDEWDLSEILPKNTDNSALLYDFDHPGWGDWSYNGQRTFSMYWWAEPLYGYYKGTDYWVHLRNVQLLADAGVDFLFLDVTNAIHYLEESEALMTAIENVLAQGKPAPKVVYYTNGANDIANGVSQQAIYDAFYDPNSPHYHPDTWYYLDGKPLIIANKPTAPPGIVDFFTYRVNQWPTESPQVNGWPWIDFERPQRVYINENNEREVINVSVAQHPNLDAAMGGTPFYNLPGNRGRSYRNNSEGNPETDLLYGYNIAEQWEHAINQNVPFVLITGWNEWIVGKFHYSQPGREEWSLFVDQANDEYSRDIEPTRESGLKDTYYMQMASYIRKYKGIEANEIDLDEISITSLNDWNSAQNLYWDYTGDTQHRNHSSGLAVPAPIYTNSTGRNDFHELKFSKDSLSLYFYVKTVANITPDSGNNWMNLLINSDRIYSTGWEGYDYKVVSGDTIQKYENGSWSTIGTVNHVVSGNEMYVEIPRSTLGIGEDLINIEFKWSDNMQDTSDILDWYINGDVAPGARFSYVASEVSLASSFFLNKGFESPLVGSAPGGFLAAPQDASWSFVLPSGIVGNGSIYGNTSAPEGSQAAFVQTMGHIEQALDFQESGDYVISFKGAQRPGNNQTLEVYYDNVLVSTITPTSTGYLEYSTAPFAVTAGQHTIKISGTSPVGVDDTAFVDDISYAISGQGIPAKARLLNDTDPIKIDGLKIYPNPVSDIFNILVDTDKLSIISVRIFDIYGKSLYYQKGFFNNNTSINVSSLSAGIYFVNLTLDDGKVIVHKIIIE